MEKATFKKEYKNRIKITPSFILNFKEPTRRLIAFMRSLAMREACNSFQLSDALCNADYLTN